MGRKSIARERKPLTDKAKKWVKALVPTLQHKSLSSLTLDEIAVLAGKSKSTIYEYFSTKEEIYKAVVQSVLDDIAYVISEEAIQGDDVEEVYRTLLYRLSQGIEGLSLQFMEQIQNHFPEIWKIIEGFAAKVLSNLECLYKKGMEAGVFKTFNISLLMALDNHFVMSIMTNAQPYTSQGMSFHDLVTEYLELRISALKG